VDTGAADVSPMEVSGAKNAETAVSIASASGAVSSGSNATVENASPLIVKVPQVRIGRFLSVIRFTYRVVVNTTIAYAVTCWL